MLTGCEKRKKDWDLYNDFIIGYDIRDAARKKVNLISNEPTSYRCKKKDSIRSISVIMVARNREKITANSQTPFEC